MNRAGDVLEAVDKALWTRRKRHIVGGILLSASLLLCSLAYTVITLKKEDEFRNGKRD